MLYKFKSAATGDVIMLGPQGDQMLQPVGAAERCARQGIDPQAMPAAISALEAAVADAEADARVPGGSDEAAETRDRDATDAARSVGLRARVWPMIEMLRRAHAAGEPVVWGV